MPSLGKIAQCIGLSGKVGVRQDFFGYWTKPPVRLSVTGQVRLLEGKHIHLNLIQTATLRPQNLKEIDYGLQTMRNIYGTVNIGVGRILRYSIPPGFEVIDDDSEAHDLWNRYSVSNDGIDVFLAISIVGATGKSPSGGGSCDKDSKNDSGCVVAVDDNADGIGLTVGQVIGHEVGHFLGLPHEDRLPDNLMYPIVPNGGRLYGGQGGSMVLHCSIRGGCQ